MHVYAIYLGAGLYKIDLLDNLEEGIKMKSFDLSAEPTFDDMWKPTQVFLALRRGCKHLSAKWEDSIEGEPLLVFCNHPSNSSDVEGNCNEKRCPLLAQFEK